MTDTSKMAPTTGSSSTLSLAGLSIDVPFFYGDPEIREDIPVETFIGLCSSALQLYPDLDEAQKIMLCLNRLKGRASNWMGTYRQNVATRKDVQTWAGVQKALMRHYGRPATTPSMLAEFKTLKFAPNHERIEDFYTRCVSVSVQRTSQLLDESDRETKAGLVLFDYMIGKDFLLGLPEKLQSDVANGLEINTLSESYLKKAKDLYRKPEKNYRINPITTNEEETNDTNGSQANQEVPLSSIPEELAHTLAPIIRSHNEQIKRKTQKQKKKAGKSSGRNRCANCGRWGTHTAKDCNAPPKKTGGINAIQFQNDPNVDKMLETKIQGMMTNFLTGGQTSGF